MPASIQQVPPKPWDTRIVCMAECLDCGIEWGWGASDEKLKQYVAAHNERHHAEKGEPTVSERENAGWLITLSPPTVEFATINRVEVIDHRASSGKPGRVFVALDAETVALSIQDDGRTLKVFLS